MPKSKPFSQEDLDKHKFPGEHRIKWLTVESQPETVLYTSDRGLPLLCQTPEERGIVVTLENYSKWYNIQLLHPDGRVEKLSYNNPLVDINAIEERVGTNLHIDHCFHPRLLEEIAKELGGFADWRAVEMAGGRWVNEMMEGMLGKTTTYTPPE